MLTLFGRLTRWLLRQQADRRDSTQSGSGHLFGLFEMIDKGLTERHVEHALIGGFAMAAHQVVRATEDVDFLIAAERAADVNAWMTAQGYETLLHSENVSNYLHANGSRVDFVHAQRAYSRQMLKDAIEVVAGQSRVKVVRPEDMIGLKVQSSSNDRRRRLRDMEDIRALLETHRAILDMERVRTYFKVFEREAELNELLELIS